MSIAGKCEYSGYSVLHGEAVPCGGLDAKPLLILVAILAGGVDNVATSQVVVAMLYVAEIEGLAPIEAVHSVVGDDEGTHTLVGEAERDGGVAAGAGEHMPHYERPYEEVVAPLAA